MQNRLSKSRNIYAVCCNKNYLKSVLKYKSPFNKSKTYIQCNRIDLKFVPIYQCLRLVVVFYPIFLEI